MHADQAKSEHGDGLSGTWSRQPAEPTDPELLRGCRRGDPASWDALVRRYEPLVFSCARAGGLSRPDAADVTQGVFVALLDAGLEVRDDERLGSWLLTVTHRQVWRARRHLDRHADVDLPDQPRDTIQDWERMAVLYDAVVRIGSPCRELVSALYLDPARPTYAAVARRLGVAPGTIGPKRARCLQRLRLLMDEP